MPQVKIKHQIAGEKKKVYGAVKKYLQGRDTLSKLGAEIEWDDKSCTADISGGSFNGSLAVAEMSGKAEVEITIDLPLLLTPFKGKVEEELKKHLARVTV
jgi:hypothetical protein